MVAHVRYITEYTGNYIGIRYQTPFVTSLELRIKHALGDSDDSLRASYTAQTSYVFNHVTNLNDVLNRSSYGYKFPHTTVKPDDIEQEL